MHLRKRQIALAFLGLLAQACQGRTAMSETGPLLSVASRIEEAACEHRDACHAARLVQSGRKVISGEELAIVIVRLAKTDGGSECTPFETWLVSLGRGNVKRVRLLSKKCSSTFDAPSIDVIGPNRVRYVEEEVLHTSLELGLVDITDTYEIALDPVWLSRHTQRRKPQHGDGLETIIGLRDFWEHCVFHGNGPCERLEYTLPRLEVAEGGEFANGGWKTTSLGDCAMIVDGTSLQPPNDASSGPASVRALLSGDTLYVEVHDPQFVTKGRQVDRLTIRLAFVDAIGADWVWTLTMDGAMSGETESGYSKASRRAEVALVDSETRRFRMPGISPQFLFETGRLIYENTDDGRTVRQRLVSASEGRQVWTMRPDDARCVPRDGALHLEWAKPRPEPNAAPSDPDKPLLP